MTATRTASRRCAIHAGQEPDPTDRRGRPADLPDLDVQAGRRRRAARRLRVQPQRPTRPGRRWRSASPRSRAARRGLAFASGLAAEDTLLRTVCAPGRPRRHPRRRLRRHVPAVRQGARAAGASSTPPVDADRPRRGARRDPARPDQGGLGRDADQPAARHRRHRRARRRRARGARRCWSSTTRSPRRTCSSRSRSAPTSSCTRRRSTSAATPTSSAARWSSPTTRARRASSRSTRTRWARSPGRSTPGWCCAASRRWRVRMERHCDNAERVVELLLEHPRGDRRCYYPGWPRTPGTRSPRKQMRRFGGMVSFRVRRRRGRGARGLRAGPSCSPSASRSAASSR